MVKLLRIYISIKLGPLLSIYLFYIDSKMEGKSEKDTFRAYDVIMTSYSITGRLQRSRTA